MKNLKLWQKAGLVAAIVGGLTLGGITPKYDSKGLESKLPSITMSTAEAQEVNPEGYQVPDLTGLTPYARGYLKSEPKVYVERFYTKDGGIVARISYDNGKERKILGYTIDHDKKSPVDYGIYDMDGDGIFESKYGPYENVDIPDWIKS
ncbi:MAG: hypothetical protein Q8N77_00430 [Nanoarchaeota archaeon]|nr:hypothetical protein [Nanoarchaeota archaeon]